MKGAVAVLVVAGCAAVVAQKPISTTTRKLPAKDEAYASALKAYKDELRLGTTRAEVDTYLKTKNVAVENTCSPGCSDNPRATAAPVYVLIGKGKPPWYCSAELVFLDLEFDAVPPRQGRSSLASDKLKSISIRRAWRDCM